MADRALLLDISNHQGVVDYDALAHAPAYLNGAMVGTVEGIIAKATEGVHFTDAYFSRNWAEAARTGLARGAYHFIRADLGTDPLDEAGLFWDTVAPSIAAGDNLLLDIEDFPGRANPPDLNPWVSAFMAELAGLCGFVPGIYSTAGYLDAHNLTNQPHLADHGLWLASWYDYPPATFPAPPPLWPVTYLWQFTSSGEVAGVAGHVDMNYCNGSIEVFRAYGKPAGASPPPLPRDTLDAWYRAWQDARAVYHLPPDLADWDAQIPYFDAIKARHGVGP